MKEFLAKNKTTAIIIAGLLFVLIIGIASGTVYHFSTTLQKKDNVVSASDTKVKETKKDEKKNDKKENDEDKTTDVSESSVEVSADADDVTEEGGIIEDSELDVVEATLPAAEATPVPEQQAAEEAAASNDSQPEVNLTDMAQTAQYPFEIHVNKQMNCITVYAMDNNGSYSIPYKAMICSTGNATPLGTFKTPAKYVWKVLKGGVWGQYSTRITGSILFHSVPYRAANKSTLYAAKYNKLGTTASAGCVRLTTIDAKWIYDNCPIGTTVIIYNDANPGPLGKPTAMKLPDNSGWDPTDPDEANPWRGKVVHIDGVGNKTVEAGTGFDVMNGVSATDASGNNITGSISVSTNVDANKPGNYFAQYIVTDSSGTTVSEECSITVVDTVAPKITKSSDAKSVVGLDFVPNNSNICSRINVSDASNTNISYKINNTDWGYSVDYTVSDESGNVSTFNDTFRYVEYEFVGSKTGILGSDNDYLSGMQLKGTDGTVINLPDSIVYFAYPDGSNKYVVEMKYEYSTALGTKKCEFERVLEIQ